MLIQGLPTSTCRGAKKDVTPRECPGVQVMVIVRKSSRELLGECFKVPRASEIQMC